MGKLKTTTTKGGSQQYTRGGGEGERAKIRVALGITQSDKEDGPITRTAKSREIKAAQMDPDLKKEFIEKYGVTPNKAEALMSAAFAGAGDISSSTLEDFYQDRVEKEPKIKNKLDNKKTTRSMADRPRKGSDEPITKRKKGGLIRTGAKDYRKGGMFY